MVLQDYEGIVGTCASISTMGHMLAGVLICKDVYKKGTSTGFDPMPFVGGLGMCILMLRYALFLKDPAMIQVNIFGIVTNAIYTSVLYYFSSDTRNITLLLGRGSLLITLLLAYAEVENPKYIEFRFGIFVTVLFLLLVASPLVHLKDIIKTRNTDILPFPIIFMGTLVSFQWMLYGFIINNSFVIFQNVIGFILCATQLSLFLIFPSKKSSESKKVE